MLYQKQVSRVRTSNYIPLIIDNAIICPCPWYLLLAQHYSYRPVWCLLGEFRKNCPHCHGTFRQKLQSTSIKCYLKIHRLAYMKASVKSTKTMHTLQFYSLKSKKKTIEMMAWNESHELAKHKCGFCICTIATRESYWIPFQEWGSKMENTMNIRWCYCRRLQVVPIIALLSRNTHLLPTTVIRSSGLCLCIWRILFNTPN